LFVFPLSDYAAGRLLYLDSNLPATALLPASRATIAAAHALGIVLILGLSSSFMA
jgi:hypothetical protein